MGGSNSKLESLDEHDLCIVLPDNKQLKVQIPEEDVTVGWLLSEVIRLTEN